MFRYLWLMLFLGLTGWLSGQPMPGGVAEPVLWLQTQRTAEGQATWYDRIQQRSYSPETAQLGQIHYHPALQLDGTVGSRIPLRLGGQQTVFSVQQVLANRQEASIWSWTVQDTSRLVLSTERMADLQRARYLSYPRHSDQPQLHTYLRHQTEAKEQGWLEIAHPPLDRSLPLTSFAGTLPELIIYDRVLSAKERRQVTSYLSLKYGLTIQDPNNSAYLGATGDTLWHAKKQRIFHHRIAGLGLEPLSGWQQRMASGSLVKNPILTLHTIDTLKGAGYLVWGDDAAPKRFQPWEQPAIWRFERQWLLQRTGAADQLSTQLSWDSQHWLRRPTPTERYCLLVDRSGKGDYRPADTEVFLADTTNPEDRLRFGTLSWDPDGSGTDVFTLAIVPELWMLTDYSAPACGTNASGQLQSRIIGGLPPYQLTLQALEGTNERLSLKADTPIHSTELTPGAYALVLQDAIGQTYRDTLFLEADAAPLIPLQTTYTVPPDGQLTLDASTAHHQGGAQYQWVFPNGQVRTNPMQSITSPGRYRVQVESQGCRAYHTLWIRGVDQQAFDQVRLFPNPTVDGTFELDILLRRPGTLQIRLFDAKGRLLLADRLPDQDRHRYRGQLRQSGTYVVELSNGSARVAYTLIVP